DQSSPLHLGGFAPPSGCRSRRRFGGRRFQPCAETNREPVPAIDDVDHEREIHLVLVAELGLERTVGAFVVMAFREPRQRLGPAQRGPLPLRVARRFAPGRKQVDALVGLAPAAGLGRMHVDAVGAAVDLRGANLHELSQTRLEAGVDRERSAGPNLHDVGGGGEEIDLGCHWAIPFAGSDDMTSRGSSIVTSPRKNFASLRFIPAGMASNDPPTAVRRRRGVSSRRKGGWSRSYSGLSWHTASIPWLRKFGRYWGKAQRNCCRWVGTR